MSRQSAKITVAIVALSLAIALVIFNRRGAMTGDMGFYYDLGSGKVFAAPTSLTPPIDVPGGGAMQGVRARVVGCDGCGVAVRHVLYLESYTDEARSVLAQSSQKMTAHEQERRHEALTSGQLVAAEPAAGTPPQWVSAQSSAGQTLRDSFRTHCQGRPAQFCTP